jgi:hypothetical protein
MAREFSLGSGFIVARSLRITRTTHLLVASITAAVALNATVAVQFLAPIGQAVLLSILIVFIALGSAAVSRDIFTRSSQAVSSLRSIGATSGSLSSAVMLSTLEYGGIGSAAGAIAGVALGAAFGGSSGFMSVFGFALVVCASIAAVALGAYAGGRSLWRS